MCQACSNAALLRLYLLCSNAVCSMY